MTAEFPWLFWVENERISGIERCIAPSGRRAVAMHMSGGSRLIALADASGTVHLEWFPREASPRGAVDTNQDKNQDLAGRIEERLADVGRRQIANDREYEITKHWAQRFRETASLLRDGPGAVGTSPEIAQAMIDAADSQAETLEEQLAAYEAKKAIAAGTMTRAELGALLRSVAAAVESGDSAEGRIQWQIGEAAESVVVDAGIRTGNLEGQGGYMLFPADKER